MVFSNNYHHLPVRQNSSLSDYTPSMRLYSSNNNSPMHRSSSASDYTPLRSLRLTPNPQVVFSKVARKPVLHHAQSWSPSGLERQSSFVIPKYQPSSAGTSYHVGAPARGYNAGAPADGYDSRTSNGTNYTSYSSLGRRSSTSDYQYPPSHTQSDYETGSLNRRGKLIRTDAVSSDYGGRSRTGRACDCDPYSICNLCASKANSTELTTVNEATVYDSLTPSSSGSGSRYNKNRRVMSEKNNNHIPVSPAAIFGSAHRPPSRTHRRLDYVMRSSNHSKSMDHLLVGDRTPTGHTGGLSYTKSINHDIVVPIAPPVPARGVHRTPLNLHMSNHVEPMLNGVEHNSHELYTNANHFNTNRNVPVKQNTSDKKGFLTSNGSRDSEHQYDTVIPDGSVATTPKSRRRRSIDSKSSTPSTSTTGSLVKKEWNKLRNLLGAVSAIKATIPEMKLNADATPQISKIMAPPPTARAETEGDSLGCRCCDSGPGMKCPASFDRRIQSARSCESLLASGNRIPSLDLGEGHMQVVPLHRSMLGEDNCIQLTSSDGSSKFYSCRNSEERSQWLNHLRKTVNPGEEQMRRCDTSLKLWIQEAKNCTNKKKYYCEVCLDKALYARTSTKLKTDMLFWGEQFDFDNLPTIRTVTVTLHREPDKKKKRDKNQTSTQIGSITIPVSELQSRTLVEKWMTVTPSTINGSKTAKENKSELPQLRVKLRYQTVDILPLASYNPLVKYVKSSYLTIVERLEPYLSVRAKDDISCSLVHILQREQLARRFLCDIIISEIPKHENLNLMLRGNTIATKAIEAYMKLVGNKYLHDTLEDFIRLILDSEDSCEVDPGKLQNNATLQRNQCNLISYCEMVWGRIINSHSYFPSELRDVFTSFRRQCEHIKKPEVSDNLISACIFLRFLCPAIMSPSLFGLCQELPEERQSRNFTLVAKTLQSLANFTKFGSKEDYMVFMNEFVEREWNQMQNFLKQVSSSDHSYPMTQFEGYIDTGKHLSLLHSQLCENLPKPESEEREKFSDLDPLLTDITNELNNVTSSNQNTNTLSKKSITGSIEIGSNSISSQNKLTVPPGSRPESDEYVELCQDRTTDYLSQHQLDSTPRASRPTPGRQLNVQSSRDVHSANQYAASSQPRPSLNVGQDSNVVTLARLPSEKPKDPDADRVDRDGDGRYDSDTMRSTNTDTLRSNSSSGSRKIVRHRVWDRVLTANDLVNGDYIDLISYMDPDSSGNLTPRDPDTITTSSSKSDDQPEISDKSDGKQEVNSTTSPRLARKPAASNTAVTAASQDNSYELTGSLKLSSLRKAKPASLQPGGSSKEPPLAFVNPAFKHSTASMLGSATSPRRGSEAPSGASAEYTPLPNKFNSLNLRGRSKKTAADNKPGLISPPLKPYHRDHPLTGPHTQHTDHPHSDMTLAAGAVSDTDSDLYRDEKRFGCARFPAMELYPETSARPAPDGSNSVDTQAPHHSTEMLSGGGERPTTPTSWAGSQLSLNSQQTGIRNLQRSIDETSKIKQEYEAEVTVLRGQLGEAQSRLSGTETRLAYQAEQTNQVMEEWKVRLDKSEERLRAQQHEKDEQIKNIIQRLLAIEEDLRQEQQEMKSAISRKEQIIDSQERRIRELDAANNKLQKTLNDMKERVNSRNKDKQQTYKTTLYVNDYKSSFC